MRKRKASIVFLILAIGCFIYMLTIFFAMGFGTKFFLIWGVLAVGFGIIAFILSKPLLLDRIPKWLKRVCVFIFTIAVLFFVVIEGIIFTRFNAKASPQADYCIVLGAQWKPQGPSYVLKKRLDKAYQYLSENPQTIAIVSGGQGANEHISEAEGMANYLIDAGIDKDRIILEDKSTSTCENLLFSANYLDKDKDKIVIVTNNFHMFRALALAKKQGYNNVEGLSADSYPAMLPNNMLREFMGVVKDFLVGNL